MLTADDPLPARPRRILVAGTSGVGKSTLAARIADGLDLEYTELDSLFHGPNWTPRPEFLADVERLVAAEGWVTEWQYGKVRPLLASRADLLVWLDLPFWRVTLPRVVTRTIRRRLRREELWNGNLEGPLWQFFTDDEHIIRWSWRTRRKCATLVAKAQSHFPNLTIVRLRSRREVERWVDLSICSR